MWLINERGVNEMNKSLRALSNEQQAIIDKQKKIVEKQERIAIEMGIFLKVLGIGVLFVLLVSILSVIKHNW